MIDITKLRHQKQIRMNTMMESGIGSLLKHEPLSKKDLLALKNTKFGVNHQLSPAPQFN